MLEDRWRVTLCGSLTARQGAHVVTRYRTQKTGLLLAFLALHGDCMHGREEVAELFWPDSDQPLHSLRLALASLRRQLEPPGVIQGQVLVANRTHVALASGAVYTDVGDFKAAIAAVARANEVGEKLRLLRQAIGALAGEFLPGAIEEWVLQERALLLEQVQMALKALVELLEAQEDWAGALLVAMRWAHQNPFNEEAHLELMRILMALERPGDALQCFQRLREFMWEELRVTPSSELCGLAAEVQARVEERVDAARHDAGGSSSRKWPVGAFEVDREASVSAARLPTSASVPGHALHVVRLPMPLTPFFGREQELDRLCALLAPRVVKDALGSPARKRPVWHPRVVTVVGTGGSGKTRLAIEAARACAATVEGMVCFVGLVDAETPERMVQLIAEAVCPRAAIGREPLELITNTLGLANALLILDNMEQVVEAGTEVVRDLLQRLPGLKVLVTSRVRLNLDGERELVVGSLPMPEQVDAPECLLRFASVELFVDRAQAARADFQLTARNAASLVALCQRLEGMPLALELAASWAQTLSPAQMLVRLDRRFDLLRARRKGIAGRHQALEVCIDWGFCLLAKDVQTFFCRLCLLRGDWTLETAETITGDSLTLEKVQRLREASFLLACEVSDADGQDLRFCMLESLREFGLNHLARTEIDAGYERLAKHMIATADVGGLKSLHTENVRAVVHWCRQCAQGLVLELDLLNNLKLFWFERGGWAEGRDWVQDALRRHAGQTTSAYRHLWNTMGSLHWLLNETAAAKRSFEEALAAAEQACDDRLAVRALNNLAMTSTQERDLRRACALGEQSLHFALRLGDQILVTALLNNLGSAHMALDEYEAAREYLEQSLQRSREQDTPGIIGLSLANLASIAQKLGDTEMAHNMFVESLQILRGCQDQSGVSEVLRLLADVLEVQGDAIQAHQLRSERAALQQRLAGG